MNNYSFFITTSLTMNYSVCVFCV